MWTSFIGEADCYVLVTRTDRTTAFVGHAHSDSIADCRTIPTPLRDFTKSHRLRYIEDSEHRLLIRHPGIGITV